MPRIRASAFIVLVALALGLASEVRAEKLAIGLVLTENRRRGIDDEALNAATEAFLLSRRFTVVEREALDGVFQEKGLKGFIGESQGADLGQTLGLDWIGLLSYSVDKVRDPEGQWIETYVLSVRLMDVDSARVVQTIDSKPATSPMVDGLQDRLQSAGKRLLFQKVEEMQALESLEDFVVADSMDAAGARLLENLLAAFPPEGYVIQVIGDREVVVDLGAGEGLREGDLLEVFTEEAPIIHPVTGREIPGRKVTRAMLKVLSVDTALSTCKVKNAEGPVEVGAVVRFKPKEGALGSIMNKLPFGR